MNYSKIQKCDIANGNGIRTTLFVSGCRRHCSGCFNPEQQNFKCGQLFTIETIKELCQLSAPDYIDGLTLLGGEPFEPENACALTELTKIFKTEMPQKTIWGYSGFLFEELIARKDAKQLLQYVDVLVDGAFVESEKDIALAFRGSRNQRIIDVKQSLAIGQVVLAKQFYEENKK